MRRAVLLAILVAAVVPGFAQPLEEGRTVKKRPETTDPAVRCVLEGVPWLGFYRAGPRAPEDDPFPSCVRAFLEYRGDDVGFRLGTGKEDPWHAIHEYVMGTSGAAFRLRWDRKAWSWGTAEILDMAEDPLATFRNGLESVGYSCEVLLRKDCAQSLGLKQEVDYDEAAFRDRTMASIRKGVPVIALGLVGPDHDCSLIAGYDDGGKALVGRAHFQDDEVFNGGVEFEEAGGGNPDPYFRKRNWFADMPGLILIGEKRQRPPDREIHRRALGRALEIMRTPVVGGRWSGQAAFAMWADTLLKDSLFKKDDLPRLKDQHGVHQEEGGGTLAEARAWGGEFLRQVADLEPAAASELLDAAKCFDAEHDLVWAIWEFTGGMRMTDEGARKFADAGIRGRIVPLIRLAREQDAQAAAHIQKALELTGGEAPKPQTPGDFGRVVLQDVPKIGYNVHLCPFPGSLCAIMQYLGDPVEYDYLMGVTGAAFRRLWNRDDGGNVDLTYLALEPFRRAAEGIEYELRPVPRDKEKMLRAIRESIARGRPVIAFGIVGPPEAGIVTGYGRGGEVLVGWSYFQDAKLPGYYEEADWFGKFSRFAPAPDAGLGPAGSEPLGLILVGDKNRWPGPSKRAILISSLKWAVDLARTAKRPNLPNHVSGLAAYEAWAKGLEADADYPKGDTKVMDRRAIVHGDQCTMLGERHNAASYLHLMSGAAPEASEHLEAAAELYDEVAGLGSKVWLWGHSMGPEVARASAEPRTRREIAGHVRAAAAKEAEAVDKLEAALKVLTGDAGGRP